MKDFDFEEIDKAVAGALATDTPLTGEQSVELPTVTPTPALEPVREVTPESEKPSETPRIAPAARRSSGRFMDVVHPSSDMRGRTTFTPPAAPSAAASQTAPVEPQKPAESNSSTQEDELEAWAKPLESPFLPDAKVEKRPLGGVASSIDIPLEDLLLDKPDELRIEAPNEPRLEATSMPDPIDFAAHSSAPAFEIEDTGVEEQPGSEPVAGEVTPIEELAKSSIHADIAAELELAPEKPAEVTFEVEPEPQSEKPVAPVEEPTGPTSITQQYTEQPSSAEAPGAIYDTEAYHQPVVPVVKKKSGIWVVLWILLLIILGAGAGVVFYLFVLPLL